MRITIVYDNTAIGTELISDWGWSCFIETGDRSMIKPESI